jgi:hexosaminidase
MKLWKLSCVGNFSQIDTKIKNKQNIIIMPHKSNILSFILMFTSIICLGKHHIIKPKTPNLGIIPAPNNVVAIGVMSDIKEIKIFLPDDAKTTFITQILTLQHVTFTTKNQANVSLIDFPELEREAYRLQVKKDKIDISTSSSTGLQYALVSLAQMIEHVGFPLPEIVIEDSPKFAYRGMHLDVARHFYGIEDVKKYLDYMAYYKFNNFHWHLTDDQGWRIEIKKHPKLQEVAAYRKETLIGHYNDQPHRYDGQRYGGYYTQEEVKEIVNYAALRNINVIPEIEMPGHAQAALSAYPELGCENKPYEAATKWGIFEDVFCPNDVTFKFLEDVIDEVVTLFPSKYIHIGGDECPKVAWEKSSFCQALIKQENLKDEHGLQSYFIQRMEKYINAKGKQIIGWDEILEGGLAPNATVMSWRGIEGGLEAARQNHDVIMTPGTHCYFDHYQSESPDEPLAIGGLTTVEKVYSWEPIPSQLEADKRKYILGGQSNLWSEYIKKYDGVEYMVYARGMAMAEALWSRDKDYTQFLSRYEKHNFYWQENGANMAFHLYDLNPIISAGNGDGVSLRVDVSSDTKVSFSFNNEKENLMDTSKPLQIKQSGNYLFKGSKNGREGSPISLDFNLHKATTAKIKLVNEPSDKYKGNGAASIVNGVIGSSKKYGGSEWLGFDGKDCIGTLDFGKTTTLNEIVFRFFKGEGQWIYLPKSIEIMASEDGVNFKSIQKISTINSETKIATISHNLNNLTTRYLKFSITNFGKIPDGNQGAGHQAWLFIDEVIVR